MRKSLTKANTLQNQMYHRVSRPQKSVIVVDTDCGFDDFIAISALHNESTPNNINDGSYQHNHPSSSKVHFVSTVAGIQDDPYRGTAFFRKTFPPPLLLATGADTSQQTLKSDDPDWLIEYRKGLNLFMDNDVTGNDTAMEDTGDGDAKIKCNEFLEKQDDDSVDFVLLGPLTNLKNWLLDPSMGCLIQKKAKSIWIMGGNTPHHKGGESEIQGGTIEPEYNFAQDPYAANTVLSSELIADKIFMLPAQSCIDIPSDNTIWLQAVELAKSRNGLISKILNYNKRFGDFKYDPLCAFVFTNPGSFQLEELKVEVNASTGLVSFAEGRHGKSIKFVTHVDHFGGFLPWIYEEIEKEPMI